MTTSHSHSKYLHVCVFKSLSAAKLQRFIIIISARIPNILKSP